MIIGIGTDLIEIDRIEKSLKKFSYRFEKRIFTNNEQAHARNSKFPAASYAKRFAAKEAFLKALGTGLTHGITFREIEIINTLEGKPQLYIHGQAFSYLQQKFGKKEFQFHVSLTDTVSLAQAFVIISMD